MKKKGKAISKPLTLLLAVCLLFTSLGMTAAKGAAQPCPSHAQHNAECGYVAAVEGQPCKHAHDAACGYAEAVEAAPCKHEHNTDCGYVAAVEGSPCKHTCATCIPPAQTAKTVTAFAQLPFDVWFQDVASGAKMGDMTLPATLLATVDGVANTEIAGVTWACAAYDAATGMTESEYEWTPVLPAGYALDLGKDENGTTITPPSIFALVDGGGLMAPMAAPVITDPPSGALPDGMVGVYYMVNFKSSTSDVQSWSDSGGLPNGLTKTFSGGSNADYSGIPTAPGDYTFSITASNASGTSDPVTYTIKIRPHAESPTVGFDGKQWLVIGDDGTGVAPRPGALTLLSKNHVFGTTYFNPLSGSNYSGSSLQSAMSNAANALTAPEKALIIDRDLTGSGSTYTIGTEMAGGNAADQLFWPLSYSEYNAIYNSSESIYGVIYWLRSPGGYSNNALYGRRNGGPALYGDVSNLIAIRPAFWLNLSSVLFTSAATGGKPGAAGPTLSAATPPTNFYKFTMIDSTNLSLSSVTPTGLSGRTITFNYAGATPGKTLSAIVKGSDGTVKFYGKLLTTTTASGTVVQVTLPNTFAAGDTLQIFVEEINGDNYTDFASTPVTLPIAAQAAPTTPVGGVGQITGVDSTMEYRLSGATGWTPITGTSVTGLAAGSYEVRHTNHVDGGTVYLNNTAKAVTVTDPAPSTYTLTLVSGTDATNTGPYTAGAQVSITANAAPAGQVFDYWSSDNGGTFASANSANTTFTMPSANVTVTAHYKNDGGGGYNPPPPAPQPPVAPKTAFPCEGEVTGKRISVFKLETLRTRLFYLNKGEEFTLLGLANGGRAFQIEQDGRKGFIGFKDIAATFGASIKATAIKKGYVYIKHENGKLKRDGYFPKDTVLTITGISGKYLENKRSNITYWLDAAQWKLWVPEN